MGKREQIYATQNDFGQRFDDFMLKGGYNERLTFIAIINTQAKGT
jgi:hypothetical protein